MQGKCEAALTSPEKRHSVVKARVLVKFELHPHLQEENPMNRIRSILIGVSIFAAGLVIGNLDMRSLRAQESYPTKSEGLDLTKLGVVSKESMSRQTGLTGYVLQLRMVTMEPGGQIARHKHDTRPGLVYTLEGSWTEGRPDGERDYPAGGDKAILEDADTDHWFYNRTDKPVKFIICDLDNR